MQATLEVLHSVDWHITAPRPRRLSHDLTHLSPEDVDGWLHTAHHQGVALSTINTSLRALHRLCAFLQAHGHIPRTPVLWRRHRVLVPQHWPRPMAEEDLIRFSQVIKARRDRLLCLLMRRGGLRGGEVSTPPWSAITAEARAIRIDTSKGLIARVVY
jgi:site-specific recombinase XerC